MTVKNIKGREERPIKESQKEGGGLQPEEKPLEKPYLRPGLGRAEQRSLPAHGSNIRTSQLTQPRVWGSKMIKCCLVWVQSNKSSLTEVTLSLEQVCRSICQGSERANAENRCAVPLGVFTAKSTSVDRTSLTCCGTAILAFLPANLWSKTSRGGLCLQFSL